jgi:hypothetical protein
MGQKGFFDVERRLEAISAKGDPLETTRGPMSFAHNILTRERPDSVRLVALPRRTSFFPSPTDWRDEVIYFLLPDRFSDGAESGRPLVDPKDRGVNRPGGFRWDEWAASGGGRFQGGTLNGITSKLDYLNGLGVTTLWVGPTFKQRTHSDSYHGYAIQDFLDIDSMPPLTSARPSSDCAPSRKDWPRPRATSIC